jgi:3-hydroxyacyl-[acyl-carrier-protein] dehydratase
MTSMDVIEITNFLPHRYPMLMVDRITEITDEKVIGLKNVTYNEPFFTGHFPGFPVMPGVLIVEAMAQVGGILVGKLAPHTLGKIMFLASVEEAKFRKPVMPGDQMFVEMKLLRLKHTVAKMHGVATVDGQVVAEATLMCKLTDRPAAGFAETSKSPVEKVEPEETEAPVA